MLPRSRAHAKRKRKNVQTLYKIPDTEPISIYCLEILLEIINRVLRIRFECHRRFFTDVFPLEEFAIHTVYGGEKTLLYDDNFSENKNGRINGK